MKSALESNVLHMNSYFAILIHDWKSLVRKFTSLSFSCVSMLANHVVFGSCKRGIKSKNIK